MGQFMDPQVQTFQPEDRGYMSGIQDFFESGLQETPDTPYSEQAASQTNDFISQFGPAMEKFFYGMMQNGGMGDTRSILRNMQARGDRERGKTQQQVMASGLPMQSSAMARAVTDSLAGADLDRNIAMGGIELDEYNKAQNRRFQGASGLGGMPGLYAAPSSIEQAMFSMQSPYDLARMQAQSNYYNNLMGQNFYQPERIMGPSDFDKYVSPFLTPLLEGLGSAAGAGLF